MEIIDFLFSNIAFLVAIIWFVASIFTKKQKEEQERQRHPRPVAKPIEIEMPWEKAEQAREEPRHAQPEQAYSGEVFEQKPLASEQLSSAEKIRQRTEELLSRVERIQDKENVHLRERNSANRERNKGHAPEHLAPSVSSSARRETWTDLSQLDRQDVVQGMVWSHVFGLPRAKEPHRTNSYLYSRHRK